MTPITFLEHLCKSGIVKGRGPLPGFGVSPKNLFFLFLLAAAGGEQKQEGMLGRSPKPQVKGATLDNPP